MKKLLAYFLALLMILTGMAAQAEEPLDAGQSVAEQPQAVYDELVVGSTTALSGSFFTEMWGNNTSDIDVRLLLHGYNLMEWKTAMATYGMDETVVSGMVVTERYTGDRTYNIALYDDLKYSDGSPITAYDYAFSILLSVAPEVAEIGGKTTDSDYILGMDEYKAGENKYLAGVRVLNDHQLSITVKADYLPFFYELALLDYCPYPISVIAPGCEVADDGEGVYIRNIKTEEELAAEAEARAAAEEAGEEYVEPEEEPIFTAELLKETILNAENGYLTYPAVVSGPYTLTAFDFNTRTAEFAINPYYKGNSMGQLPQIPKIIFRTVANETMMEELESGEVDLLHKVTQAETLDAGLQLVNEAEGSLTVTNYPRSGFSFIGYCCERPATQSKLVRQAIAHCFDKTAFVTDYVRNYGIGVDGYYGIGQWMYELVVGSMPAPIDAPAEPAEGATAEELAAYEEELAAYEELAAAWAELSMDNVKTYALDMEAAANLLVQDGWTLNRAGEDFDPEADDVRCKEINDEIVPLELSMIYPEGNAAAAYLTGEFVENLKQAGILLTVEAKPFTELLQIYYRQQEREVDMIYLASNFAYVFEPSATFNPEDAYQGSNNRTAIVDEELYELAVDMRKTEPGDVLTYCQKWLAFQEYYSEVLPSMPVYSNVYFDFHTSNLQDYAIAADVSWARAVVGAYLGDVMEEDVVADDEFEIIG